MLFAEAVLMLLWCEVGCYVGKKCFFECFGNGGQ